MNDDTYGSTSTMSSAILANRSGETVTVRAGAVNPPSTDRWFIEFIASDPAVPDLHLEWNGAAAAADEQGIPVRATIGEREVEGIVRDGVLERNVHSDAGENQKVTEDMVAIGKLWLSFDPKSWPYPPTAPTSPADSFTEFLECTGTMVTVAGGAGAAIGLAVTLGESEGASAGAAVGAGFGFVGGGIGCGIGWAIG